MSDAPAAAGSLPASIAADLTAPLRRYWLDRVNQHLSDSYCGVRLSKFPEDLRTYEHLLWLSKPDTVIEIGSQFGGSALWFRDRLRALGYYGQTHEPSVIAIDVDTGPLVEGLASADPAYAKTITVIEGDVLDPELPDRVAAQLRAQARCLVVEDSAHNHDTTRAALEGFARFVPLEGFFVVEDGCVDVAEMRASEAWPRGVLAAISEWLDSPPGRDFAVRRDLELYGITCHPHGYLQRQR